jgi:hypothetical protein
MAGGVMMTATLAACLLIPALVAKGEDESVATSKDVILARQNL